MTQNTSTLWRQLAAQATAIANDMRDPQDERLMREIAERYEALASRAEAPQSVSGAVPDRA
ncbi:MAG TPA: hypothetical protein VFL55_03355 [Acetobacteraceae bacterium]|nr:hypothetical protein [Acetobacteraceae bacterium]